VKESRPTEGKVIQNGITATQSCEGPFGNRISASEQRGGPPILEKKGGMSLSRGRENESPLLHIEERRALTRNRGIRRSEPEKRNKPTNGHKGVPVPLPALKKAWDPFCRTLGLKTRTWDLYRRRTIKV